MKKTVDLIQIGSLIPPEFQRDIKSIDIIPLKAKFTDENFLNVVQANVQITINPSAYYPNGGTATLCKLFNGNTFFFPRRKSECVFDFSNESSLYAQTSSKVHLKKVVADELQNLFPAAAFGCCSRYKECSRAGKCLHDNAFYAGNCMYKKNLDGGRNFYKEV